MDKYIIRVTLPAHHADDFAWYYGGGDKVTSKQRDAKKFDTKEEAQAVINANIKWYINPTKVRVVKYKEGEE